MHHAYIGGIEPPQVGYYLFCCLKPLVMLFSDSVTHYLCLFSVSNLLLDRSPDTNTLEGGVTCCTMDCRFHFQSV